jgi:translation initiation factor IF-2
MGKKRIHELAKELSMSSADLLQRMAELKILPGVKLGASHSIEDRLADEIKARIASHNQMAAMGVVVRRRKKGAEPEAGQQPDGQAASADGSAGAETGPREGQGPEDEPDRRQAASAEPEAAPRPGAPRPGAPQAPPGQSRQARQAQRYDKATIVGVQSKIKTPDPKVKGKGPAQPADRPSATPDFLRLSPHVREAEAPPRIAGPPAQPEVTLVPAPEGSPAAPPEAVRAAEPAAPRPPAPAAGTEAPQAAAQEPEAAPEAAGGAPVGTGPEVAPAASPGAASGQPRPDKPRETTPPASRRITRELGTGVRPARGQSEPAKVVGMARRLATEKPEGPGGRPGPGGPGGRPGPGGAARPPLGTRPGAPRSAAPGTQPAGGRPAARPYVPGARPGQKPDAGPPPASGDARKRPDRSKKKGGFGDRGGDDASRAKRRELVERTDLYSEGSWERSRSKKGKMPKKVQSKTEITVPKAIKRRIKVDEVITVSELAHRLSLKAGDIIKKLMGMGVMAGLNQSLDFDTATLVAAEFGYEVEKSAFDEGDLLSLPDVGQKYPLAGRPPVVTIMGHVDHGKTSLLDYIRKTKIQEGEAGGITQHIGAYHVKVGERYITFLDTPGHEAFTSMRSRGAQVTDLVILIVAADDGVMPQTREAADHARAAKVPILVAINKIDKPGADPERIRRQMMELGLTQEAWGGDTVFVDISAKTGQGVDELLDMILLQADMLDLKARADGPARGRIIEARLDKGRGAVATVLVGEGLLKQGDAYVCGAFHGKLRALFNDQGQRVESAGPAIPVEIQGISGVPQAGDEFIVMEDERQARQVSQHRLLKQRESELVKTSRLTLENLFDHIKAGAVKGLNLIIKADVQGSLEAILDAVGKLSTPEIKITVIHSSTGTVSETDIMLASASKALIICFGVKPPASKVTDVAESEQVQIRFYDVIYKLLDDIKEAMAGLLDPVKSEKILGQADVRAVFTITKVGVVAGSYVTDGKVTRGAKVRIQRGGQVVYDGRVASLKREKNDVREVVGGYECGISLDGHNDVRVGDHLEFYQIEETAATVALINEAVERAAATAARASAAAAAEAEA